MFVASIRSNMVATHQLGNSVNVWKTLQLTLSIFPLKSWKIIFTYILLEDQCLSLPYYGIPLRLVMISDIANNKFRFTIYAK